MPVQSKFPASNQESFKHSAHLRSWISVALLLLQQQVQPDTLRAWRPDAWWRNVVRKSVVHSGATKRWHQIVFVCHLRALVHVAQSHSHHGTGLGPFLPRLFGLCGFGRLRKIQRGERARLWRHTSPTWRSFWRHSPLDTSAFRLRWRVLPWLPGTPLLRLGNRWRRSRFDVTELTYVLTLRHQMRQVRIGHYRRRDGGEDLRWGRLEG